MATREEIAIVGMSGRFPGARNVEEFWSNLCAGVESIRPFTEEELTTASVSASMRADPDFVNAGAVMDGADKFDAAFFGMTRREAELTDPQHRVFLECAWEAIEHAGYNPQGYDGRIGVFGGVAANTYFQKKIVTDSALLERTGNYPMLVASEREYAITRVAFKLGLKGPAISLNTACSTSAVAVHLASQSLLTGESDFALAGGARIRVPLSGGYVYQEDGILSPDGHCRAFDARARGTVAASGVAIIALKRLSDARRDGDTIYAIIKGSAVNNDGADKIGYTAPSIHGQVAVIEEALAVAEVSADTIGMVEAHGTGTSLGDPIEIAALTQAFRPDTSRRQYCAVGSLKTNIGHLDAAAGVAGIMKAALSLYHEQIPPSLNFHTPNPQIDFNDSPFFVNTELRKWERTDQPRRAGVSSFGLGGTNAHVVLEEAQVPDSLPLDVRLQVLTISAKTEAALAGSSQNLAEHLVNYRPTLPDVAYTLQEGRHHFEHRRSVIAASLDEAIEYLRLADAKATSVVRHDKPAVSFLFPGGGSQHVGMAAQLYESEPAFRQALDQCGYSLRHQTGIDLSEILYPRTELTAAEERLKRVSIALPALFAIEYALAQLWLTWGVSPTSMIGHSLGEYVAATVAGVFSLDTGLGVVSERGRLMEEAPRGAMLSVALSPDEVAPYLNESVGLAVVNTADNSVLSGTIEAIDALADRLATEGVDARPIPISVASHSLLMEPILTRFESFLRTVEMRNPQIPFISNVTGTWIADEQATDPKYWTSHLKSTVRFADGVGAILAGGAQVLLEVGPGQTLTSLVRQHPNYGPSHEAVSSLPHPKQDVADDHFFLRSVATVWRAGVPIQWRSARAGQQRRRVALPTYPFDHERFWIARGDTSSDARAEPRTAPEAAPAKVPLTKSDHHPPDRGPRRTSDPGSRKDRIAAMLTSILRDLSGIEASALEPTVSFIDLGFDSLFLTQANAQFRKRFGVRITFRQLFEEAPSIDSLAGYIDSKLSADAFPDVENEPSKLDSAVNESADQGPAEQPSHAPSSVVTVGSEDESRGSVEQVIREQLQVMKRQLELIEGNEAQPNSVPARPSSAAAEPSRPATSHYLATAGSDTNRTGEARKGLTERQRTAIDDLVRRYNTRTSESKRLAQLWRPRLADNRTIVGFDQGWKELIYQIVSDRSQGSRIWDVDGNEYVDTALGFGANLFGHSPDFVVAALQDQLERGYEVGVQNRLLGEVSEMICAATGNQRLTFTYSGGEAVETAIRVARTVTGRDKVVYFTDDIHGRSDIVLGRGVEINGELRTLPMVAGVPQQVVDDAIVLEYGTERALEVIRSHASDLALVLVEPVRTRNPDLQPIDFLHELRRIADDRGFLLVFDEIVTGFRAHAGGVQAMFDVRADITTYGKAIGGGLPIGVVAGRSEYIDVIDGGPWNFGDNSFPEADITASGGTMIKHPFTLAAARAVLAHLREEGPSLQADLNRHTEQAVAAINEAYSRDGLPIHVEHFSSFFRPTFTDAKRFAELFQYYLREQGIHTNPPSPSFLSTAHTEADIQAVVNAYQAAGREMASDGFFDSPRAAELTRHAESVASAADTPVPVLPNVARFLVERSSPDANHWNVGVLLRPQKPLDPELTRQAVARMVERHGALRLRFFEGDNGWQSSMAPTTDPLPFSNLDLSHLAEREQELAIEHEAEEFQRSLNLAHGPLFRIAIFELGERGQRLLVIIHHFAMDGLSWRPFWEDFEETYQQLEQDDLVTDPAESTSFEEWAHALKRRADSDDLRSDMQAWMNLAWERVRPIPLDFPEQDEANTNESAAQVTVELSEDETRSVFFETPAVRQKIDLLVTALAHVTADWTGSDTVLFDMMGHGREEDVFDDVDLIETVGFFISYTPMVLTLPAQKLKTEPQLLTNQIHPILRRGLSFDLLRYMTSDATVRQAFVSLPRAQILFNHQGRRSQLDTVPPGTRFSLAPESSGNTHSPRGIRYYPLAISSEVWKDRLRLHFVYSENLHRRETIESLATAFKRQLRAILQHHLSQQ